MKTHLMILRLRETANKDRPDRPRRVAAQPDGVATAMTRVLREGKALVFRFSALNLESVTGKVRSERWRRDEFAEGERTDDP